MKPSWSEVAALGLLLLFAILMARGWPVGDWKLSWDAISALASFFAAATALGIAVNGERKRRMEAGLVAKSYGAQMLPLLLKAQGDILHYREVNKSLTSEYILANKEVIAHYKNRIEGTADLIAKVDTHILRSKDEQSMLYQSVSVTNLMLAALCYANLPKDQNEAGDALKEAYEHVKLLVVVCNPLFSQETKSEAPH